MPGRMSGRGRRRSILYRAEIGSSGWIVLKKSGIRSMAKDRFVLSAESCNKQLSNRTLLFKYCCRQPNKRVFQQYRSNYAAAAGLNSSPLFGLKQTAFRSQSARPHRRSGRAPSSNSSAMRCSNPSFLSREAFGSSVSRCLHSPKKRLNGSPNSACLVKLI